jgi:hypothetical protein
MQPDRLRCGGPNHDARCLRFRRGARRCSYRRRSVPNFLFRRLAPLAVITSTIAAPTKDSKSMSNFGAAGGFGLCPLDASASAFGFFMVLRCHSPYPKHMAIIQERGGDMLKTARILFRSQCARLRSPSPFDAATSRSRRSVMRSAITSPICAAPPHSSDATLHLFICPELASKARCIGRPGQK